MNLTTLVLNLPLMEIPLCRQTLTFEHHFLVQLMKFTRAPNFELDFAMLPFIYERL